MITLFISFIVIVIYIIIMCVKNKRIPNSISDTFYGGASYWFTVVLFISGFLTISGLLDLTEGHNFQFLSFFSGGGLIFVGAAPHFKGNEKTIHTVGALTFLICSEIWICIFSTPFILCMWLPMLFLYKRKDRIFWAEIIVIISLLLSLFFL